MRIATREEILKADQLASTKYKIPESLLIDKAGTGAAEVVLKKFPSLKRVLVVAGKGKNGGDGRIFAKRLKEKSIDCHLLSWFDSQNNWRQLIQDSDLIVDALVGVGLSKPLKGSEKELVETINQSCKKVVALDIPSGLSADQGRACGVSIRADLTCTFGLPKVGLYIGDGPDYAGKVVSVDIGYPSSLLDEVGIRGRVISPEDFSSFLRPRRADSHKGSYGHFLLVGGSTNRLGAPLMAARAALRTGAGLVTLALPDRCYQKIPRGLLEVMYEPLPSSPVGRLTVKALKPLVDLMEEMGCVAIGPGLGVTPDIRKIVLEVIKKGNSPVVLDADAINALERVVDELRRVRKPLVLTPHPGEMGRLAGKSSAAVQEDRLGTARDFAKRYGCHLVLKGAGTIVATPEGDYYVNPTGNPGMATAGMGDVLTGMLGALISGVSTGAMEGALLEAILGSVYLHGLAGDKVRGRLGDRGFLASDVIEEIPLAFRELTGC
ncbi:MAG: NAD(P)H-hydrate dehydratase [Deltaproteobacteria bacterium]|nr:NAD(P)H-hydrate dehydratase [Deltaproteobacteria bacterium]MBI2501371.1 NAD(P)H-hydrate dehydratase [Deltaproteobacteria bacterium]